MNNQRILITSAAGKTGTAVGVGVIDTHDAAFTKSQRAHNHGNAARASREVRRA